MTVAAGSAATRKIAGEDDVERPQEHVARAGGRFAREVPVAADEGVLRHDSMLDAPRRRNRR